MIRRFVDSFYLDVLAFAILIVAGCFWAITAFGQTPRVPPGITSQMIPVTASATGTTAGATATMPAVQGTVNYLCGLSVSPGAATAAITITVTTTGLSQNYTWNVGAPVAAAGTTGAVLTVPITPCIAATGANVAITVVAGALGAGGVNQDVNVWGVQFPINP